MMSKPFAVVFAGTPGTSKSIIAFYLSTVFNLPIFNNDNIRFEVREDLLVDTINIPEALEEYTARADARRAAILAKGKPVIFDSSVDRHWPKLKQELENAGYEYFMINMELSREFQTNLFQKTGRNRAIAELDAYLKQHEEFMTNFVQDISLTVTDVTFKNRLKLAEESLSQFLGI